MARFDDFLTLARPGLIQAPDRVIVNALRRSAREFFRRSQIWRETLDPVKAKPGTNVYDLSPPDGSYVEKILWMRYNDAPVQLERQVDIDQTVPSSGAPSYACLNSTEQTFTTWPTPGTNDTDSLTFGCVLVPTRAATTIPDQLADEWELAFVAGAQAELLATPGMPFLNVAAALDRRQAFESYLSDARRKQMSGGHVLLRVQPRPFF